MARRITAALLVVLGTLWLAPCARAQEAVDLLLVLAADVSRSVDGPKFQLQRDGYAAAFSFSGCAARRPRR